MLNQPSKENFFYRDHISLILSSYQRWTGESLLSSFDGKKDFDSKEDCAEFINNAPFILVSHTPELNPIFNYANLAALKLFEMTWSEFTSLPSTQSAESLNREERSKLLEGVKKNGFVSGYQGQRISKTGKKFLIRNTSVWNLIDEKNKYCGQAASYKDIVYL